MKYREIKFTAAALLLMAFIYYIAEPVEIMALLVPAAVHEAGHMAAIKILGLHIRNFRAELKGFCIDYYGQTSSFGHILIAASGPAAGFIYAYLASYFGMKYELSFLSLSAGISLILSMFNLLPVLPLDGGRIMAEIFIVIFGTDRGSRLSELISAGISMFVLGCALYFMFKNKGIALLLSAIWLLFYQESPKGIVKHREIL